MPLSYGRYHIVSDPQRRIRCRRGLPRTVSLVPRWQYGQRDNSERRLVLSLQRQLWKPNHSSLNFWGSLEDPAPARVLLSLKCVELLKCTTESKHLDQSRPAKQENLLTTRTEQKPFPALESFAKIGASDTTAGFLAERALDQMSGRTWGVKWSFKRPVRESRLNLFLSYRSTRLMCSSARAGGTRGWSLMGPCRSFRLTTCSPARFGRQTLSSTMARSQSPTIWPHPTNFCGWWTTERFSTQWGTSES